MTTQRILFILASTHTLLSPNKQFENIAPLDISGAGEVGIWVAADNYVRRLYNEHWVEDLGEYLWGKEDISAMLEDVSTQRLQGPETQKKLKLESRSRQ